MPSIKKKRVREQNFRLTRPELTLKKVHQPCPCEHRFDPTLVAGVRAVKTASGRFQPQPETGR